MSKKAGPFLYSELLYRMNKSSWTYRNTAVPRAFASDEWEHDFALKVLR